MLRVYQWRIAAALPHYNVYLLTAIQRDLLTVVLVSPRNPLNIGAAARAMANFGFSRLTVVAPYEEHWREAKSAVQAEGLLQNARRTQSLAEAVADCTLVLGTGTLTHRKAEQPVIPLPALAPSVQQALDCGGRVALVFGSEKHGLTRENLSLCHMLVEIPTDARQPSMNLGQAVAVCLYELTRPPDAVTSASLPGNVDSTTPAASGALERLAGVIVTTMTAANYSPRAMQSANRHDLRLLLRRLHLDGSDTRRILGLFRRILWKLNGGSSSGNGDK